PDNNARVDLDLDLGSVWSVGAVRQLYVPGHTPDTARLELSLDGVDWTTVVPNQEPPGDDFRWLIYPPVEARHLRLTLIGISAADTVELLALEVMPDATVGQGVTSDLGLDVTSLASVSAEGSGWDA